MARDPNVVYVPAWQAALLTSLSVRSVSSGRGPLRLVRWVRKGGLDSFGTLAELTRSSVATDSEA